MAGEESSSGANRPAYHDLSSSDWDDVVATPMEISTSSNTQSMPSSTSEEKKKKVCEEENGQCGCMYVLFVFTFTKGTRTCMSMHREESIN
jgi:hypothetical protein